jgi:hypothetical protein
MQRLMVCWITSNTPYQRVYSICPGVDLLQGTIPSTTESYFQVLAILQSCKYIPVQRYPTMFDSEEEEVCRCF